MVKRMHGLELAGCCTDQSNISWLCDFYPCMPYYLFGFLARAASGRPMAIGPAKAAR